MKKILNLSFAILTSLTLASCVLEEGSTSSNTSSITTSISSSSESTSNSSLDNDGASGYLPETTVNYLEDILDQEIKIYTADDDHGYLVDLNYYGNDVQAIFYDPSFKDYPDPYKYINMSEFYSSYSEAVSYQDAYYRTTHGFISGDKKTQIAVPTSNAEIIDDVYVRYTTATYILSTRGDYIGYLINGDEPKIIYYGGGYTALEEVAAYILAFGEVPPNSNYAKNKNGQKEAIAKWGRYGRVNVGYYSNDVSKYPNEPELPGFRKLEYTETDFGTASYNTGSSISRGACRICFTDIDNSSKIDDRYVFYTYNHYSDFQEYLNYYNGWGKRFGSDSSSTAKPSSYPKTTLKSAYKN